MNTKILVFILGIIVLIPFTNYAKAESEIPDWVKNNAGWWSEGLIGDSDFISGIQFLIEKGIMVIPETKTVSQTSEEIPDWVKNNAGWWSEGLIGDSDFISGIQFLIEKGVIAVYVSSTDQQFDVIVVGAGIAGLAAANELDSQGFDVLVLEARDRIGGRIWTDTSMGGTPLDLGASWIHGINNNPISELANELGIITVVTDNESISVYDSEGIELDEERERKLWDRLEEFGSFLTTQQEKFPQDTSIQIVVEKFVDQRNLSEEETTDFLYSINIEYEHEYAVDVSDLSLYWFDWEEGYSGDEVIFPKGYKQIVNSLVGDLDIRLENVVTKIEYDDNGVTVLTKDDSFDGNYVISTLPLGVLKQGTVEFSPPLPYAKQNAIDNLDVGILNKGYLMFPEAFWDDTDVIGYVSEDKGYWADFLNIHKYTGKPILLGFNAATYAEHLETKSDQETVNEMMQVLKMIYGDDIPEPENYLITRWGSDEFSFGSYSYVPVGGTSFDYDELAKPVMNRLFFAGEATIKEAPATVHGAYLSGIREAERIQNLD